MSGKPLDVILTTYLTGMPDPQRPDVVPVDDPTRLQIVPGCNQRGLHLVVFHDQLSEAFVASHTTETISFVRVETDTTKSVNDYRFYLFREWLANHRYHSVFCSDGFDVRVNRNPHELVDESYRLWVGIHRDWKIDEQTADGRYVVRMMQRFYRTIPDEVYGNPILMAGTWGGLHEYVYKTLGLITEEISTIHKSLPRVNCNLAAFNRVVYRDVGKENIWIKGKPLHSEFRKYDFEADVCFVHK